MAEIKIEKKKPPLAVDYPGLGISGNYLFYYDFPRYRF